MAVVRFTSHLRRFFPSLAALEVLGVLVALPAVVLIVSDGRLPSPATIAASPVFALAATTGALIGFMALCLGQVAPEAEAAPAVVTQAQSVVLIPLVAMRFRGMAQSNPDLRRFALVVGILDIIAIIASTIAFQRGTVAVVAAIMGFAPAVTITMAWKIDGETVRRWQWLGAGLAVAMENSHPEVLDAAHLVIGHHDDDAVAGLLEDRFLDGS